MKSAIAVFTLASFTAVSGFAAQAPTTAPGADNTAKTAKKHSGKHSKKQSKKTDTATK
jgi:hypothetical protein